MLSRDQLFTFFALQQCSESFVSTLPNELIMYIDEWVVSSDIDQALLHAAYARKEDVDSLLVMLDKNPSLLLEAGDVITPGGDEIKRVTLYEFLLGAGDSGLAMRVQEYFSRIDHGEDERVCQYERYRPYIESMLTQQPYDLKPLIELIKKATSEQIRALLNNDMTGEDDLCKALVQFRKDWAPRVLTKPCMHYNYASLQHAFTLLDRERRNLYKASNCNYDKINLVWQQLIGFEMRRLPGIDRCVMAQGLYNVIEQKESVARTYTFKVGGMAAATFPVTVADDCINGLGRDFAVTIHGWATSRSLTLRGMPRVPVAFGKFMSNKNFKLAELMPPDPTHQSSWCVML